MRTKLIALLLASAGLAVSASACRMGEENQVEATAENKSGINLAAMDKSVKPGDDFFLYANGTWLRTARSRPTAARSAPSSSRSRSWRSARTR